ncbi:MAG TPA: lyase family protein [Candidatus Nanoarchaeia archaeon]|nr:lyase family protein [Candidatus Nanoarchaeia archaeon]
MEISEIFTKKNIEMLKLLGKEGVHVREIAKRAECSPAHVTNSVKLFLREGLVKEEIVGNKKIVRLDYDSGKLKGILELIEEKETITPRLNIFDAISPLDFRYYGRDSKVLAEFSPYLSENGFIRYAARVEDALTRTLARRKICSQAIADEVSRACMKVTAQEVYKEEDRIKHNIRALANCIREKVSEKARPYVHFTTTSHDIICTADAARFRDFTNKVMVPAMTEFERTLVELSLREKSTLQIGRTHGQHAEPITFGFAIAQYASRFGHSIIRVKKSGNDLRGKIAGAVGSYNASSLFFNDPVAFEREVLSRLGLKPSPISTQIVEAEYMSEHVHSVINAFGVIANLADDMRHLQRSEIGEVGEEFGEKQVGSSTMPQKRNPINFENVKSMWKEFMPRMMTVYMDQISEHQRDLTNSASSRFIPEMLAAFVLSVKRMNKVMPKLSVDRENMKRNFEMNRDFIIAEPLYILLAASNHPDAHEYVRSLTMKSRTAKKSMHELLRQDSNIRPYLKRFSKQHIELLNDPTKYTGIAASKTEEICVYWKRKLRLS